MGGAEPVLGTNPIAAGFPTAEGQILVDLSSAAITNGEILRALKEGRPIPEGVALSPEGKLTTDPEIARKGSVLPFGGHKGYALGLMIQIFSGALVQAAAVPEPGRNYGIFMLAIEPSIFGDLDLFRSGLTELMSRIKSADKAVGVEEILIPGERAFRERERRLSEGIDVDDGLLEELKRLAI